LAGALKLLEEGLPAPEIEPLPSTPEEPMEETMVNVEIPIGQDHGITADQLVQWLIEHTLLREDQIGEIEIDQESTFIEVPLEFVDEIYQVSDQLEHINQAPKKKHRFFEKLHQVQSIMGR